MKKLLLFVFILLGFIAKSQELDELYIRESFFIKDSSLIAVTYGDTILTVEQARLLFSGGGTSVSFGSEYQIPATNATTDDFNYDSGLRYYGDSLVVDSAVIANEIGIGTSSPLSALQINKGYGTGTGIDFNNEWQLYNSSVNLFKIEIGGSARIQLNNNKMFGSGSNRFGISTIQVSTPANPVFHPNSDDVNTGLGAFGLDAGSLTAGGKEIARFSENVTEQLIFNPQADYTGTAAAPNSAYGDGDTGEYEVSDDVRNTTIGGTITKQETIDTLFIKNYLKVEGLSNIIGVMQVSRAEILYTNTSQTTIITLPANAVVWNVGIEVITLFDDTGSDLVKIGITSEDNRYNTGENVSSAWSPNVREALFGNMAGVTSNYADKITSSTNITFTYTGANADATQGVAWVYIHYTTF